MSTNNIRILSQPISYQELKELIYYKKIPISGIYKIENLINHKVYIGQSKNIIARCFAHLQPKGEHCVDLRDDFQKYGYDNFSFEVIKQTYDLNYWEIFLIQIYDSTNPEYGYNISIGGNGGNHGPEVNRKISESLKGHKHSEETKLKIGMAHEGRPSHNKGNHLSEETRRKQSLAKLGTHLSLERKQHLSNKNKGLRWFTNDKIEIFTRIKPEGSEWHIGRICKGKYKKEKEHGN